MLYDGIVFDVEGVLCSTVHLYAQAWNMALDGLETTGDVLDFISDGKQCSLPEAVLRQPMLSAEEYRLLRQDADQNYRQLLMGLERDDLLPGVAALLTWLRTAGLHLAVATDNRHAMLIIHQLGLEGAFDAVADANDMTAGIDLAALCVKACDRMCLTAERCLLWTQSQEYATQAKRMGFTSVTGNAANTLSMLKAKHAI